MPRKWYDSKIVEIIPVSSTTSIFKLKVEDDEIFDFKPGQFIILDLPISDKRTKRWRSYSIANTPNDENIIELCIVRLEDGQGTGYLFDEAEVGTPIKFKGPQGIFTIPSTLESQKLVMICTGTGVAPFRSMLQYIREGNLPFKNIELIFGTRYEEGILYREELEKMASESDNFTYSVTLSRQNDWEGEQGYVHDIYLDHCQNEADTKYYLCGWQQMIDEAIVNLKEKCNVDEKNIVYELYG